MLKTEKIKFTQKLQIFEIEISHEKLNKIFSKLNSPLIGLLSINELSSDLNYIYDNFVKKGSLEAGEVNYQSQGGNND
jgi:hypothetical protein